MNIDIKRLVDDLKEYLMSAYFNLDINIILGYLTSLDNMSEEKIIELAINLGFDLNNYEILIR